MNFKILKIFLRKIKRFFDKLLGDYTDQFYWKNIHLLKKDWKKGYLDKECLEEDHRKFLINKVLNNKKIKKILELGCGDGVNLRKISKRNKYIKLYGIDINKAAIQKGINDLSNSNHKIKLIQQNIKNLKIYKDNEFDIVFTDAVLLYIDKNKIKEIITEIIRISRLKVFLCEQHTYGKTFYNDKWVHNYKKIIQSLTKSISFKICHIANNSRSGDWFKYGKIIEIKKK